MVRPRIKWTLVPVMALVLASCTSSNSTDTGSSTTAVSSAGTDNGALVMGLLVPESGDLKAIVDSLVKSSRLAVDQINAAGGVNGQPVKVSQADDGTSAQVATVSFDKLVNGDRVNVIVGPAPSGVARAIMEKIKAAGVPTCSGSTTAADLTKIDSGGYFLRTAPSDDLQGPALAEVITADGYKQVGILSRRDEYGAGFSRSLEQALKESGAGVVANVSYAADGSNFTSEVGQVLEQKPDAVAIIGFNDDGAKVVSAMIAKDAGPDKLPLYTADGMQSSKFAETVDPTDRSKVKGLKGTAPAAAPDGVTSPFTAEFAKLKVDPIFSSYYWDCTNLLALAAQKAKSTDGGKIKASFSENLKGDNDCEDFASCKKLLDDGKSIHYRGASNRFDKWGGQEPGGGAYEVWQYDADGKVETLKVPQIKI
jgi:ABC-type branched-subunit amino acid transport system substrate-binding protein